MSAKLRVLFLHRHTFENGVGGVVEYFQYLPLYLLDHHIESYFYYEDKSTHDLIGPKQLGDMRAYSGPFIKPGFFVSSKKLKPLIQLCQQEKIDLIHAQGTYRSGYVARRLHEKTGIPYVVTSHSDIVPTNSQRLSRNSIRKRCAQILRQAAAVTHLTPSMAEISHQIGETRDKSHIIGNGIDLGNWSHFLNLPEKNYLIGLGRLEREKGFHILIDAYAQLYQQGVNTSLVIAGTGSAADDLQKQAKSYGLPLVTSAQDPDAVSTPSVIFPGYIRGDLKKRWIAQSQMVLFPTQPGQWEEPFGIVQIEAMAAGKAVVASDSATTRYLQSLGLQSLLCQADNPQDWVEKISQLLAQDSQRQDLGKTNREQAKQFDWSLVAGQYAQLYRELASG